METHLTSMGATTGFKLPTLMIVNTRAAYEYLRTELRVHCGDVVYSFDYSFYIQTMITYVMTPDDGKKISDELIACKNKLLDAGLFRYENGYEIASQIEHTFMTLLIDNLSPIYSMLEALRRPPFLLGGFRVEPRNGFYDAFIWLQYPGLPHTQFTAFHI